MADLFAGPGMPAELAGWTPFPPLIHCPFTLAAWSHGSELLAAPVSSPGHGSGRLLADWIVFLKACGRMTRMRDTGRGEHHKIAARLT